MFHVSFVSFSSFRFFAAAKVIYVMYFIVVIVGTFPQYNLVNREGVRCTIYCYTFSPLYCQNSTVCMFCYLICFFVAPRIFTNAARKLEEGSTRANLLRKKLTGWRNSLSFQEKAWNRKGQKGSYLVLGLESQKEAR